MAGVIGVGDPSPQERQLAFEVGQMIGAKGLPMVCGGLGGVMEEASRGCQEAGGVVIGLLPGPTRGDANPFVTYPIATNLGQARNVLIAHSADILIAVGQGYGTLSEIAIALKLNKKVLSYHSWNIPGVILCKNSQDLKREFEQFL